MMAAPGAGLHQLTALVAVLVGFSWPLGQASAAEVGIDASVGVQGDGAGYNVTYFNLLGEQHIDGGAIPTFRAAFPIGNLNAIEVTPGLSIAKYSYDLSNSQPFSETLTRFSLGVSYLRGRWERKSAAPYLRIGAQTQFDSNGTTHSHQYGIIVGGGLRWRLGKVIGLRSELSVGSWPWGDFSDRSTAQLSVGASAFTD
jgi:hypothetical protein